MASDNPSPTNPDSTSFWRIHLDEKWFYLHPKGRLLYLPPGIDPPVIPVKHKNHIPKVMFLGAVGEPTESFNGSVGIWPVQSLYEPKRASAAHPRVDGKLIPYLKCCTLTGEIFVQMIKDKYIPKIISLGTQMLSTKPPNSTLVVWSQLDNAGGHGLGFTLDELNLIGAISHPSIRIHFYTQPPNSPDLNVLDLGAWNSIQKTVPSLIYEASFSSASNQERIINAVQDSFLNWNAKEKCKSLFETLKCFMGEVLHSDGGNVKQPHKKNFQARIEPFIPQASANYPPLPPPPAPALPVVIRVDLATSRRNLNISIPRTIADVAIND